MRYESDYIGAINRRVEELKEELSRGYCQDFAAYTRAAGVLAGLREALDIFENLLRGDEDE